MSNVECDYCGDYDIWSRDAAYVSEEGFDEKRHLLSGVLRNATENGQRLEVVQNADDLAARAPQRVIVGDLLDRVLVSILEATVAAKSLRTHVTVSDTAYTLYYLRSETDLRYLLNLLQHSGLIEATGAVPGGQPVRLTINGWHRAEQLQLTRGRPNQAFVAMWFDLRLREAYDAGFRPALEAAGYEAVRVDLLEHTGRIDDRILAEIRRSGLLVADFTGHRQGVYFEAGFAYGLAVPVIWCCREDEIGQAHFDTRQYNHLVWNSAAELRERLESRVRALGLARSS